MKRVVHETVRRGDLDGLLNALLLRDDVSKVHVIPSGQEWIDRIDYYLLYRVVYMEDVAAYGTAVADTTNVTG